MLGAIGKTQAHSHRRQQFFHDLQDFTPSTLIFFPEQFHEMILEIVKDGCEIAIKKGLTCDLTARDYNFQLLDSSSPVIDFLISSYWFPEIIHFSSVKPAYKHMLLFENN